jgi:PKD repeat protein
MSPQSHEKSQRPLSISAIALLMVFSILLLLQSCDDSLRDSETAPGEPATDIRRMLEGSYIEGRLLVRLINTSEASAAASIGHKLTGWNARVRHAFEGALTGLYVVEGDFLVHELLPVAASDADVLYAEPDYVLEPMYQPNDPYAQSGTDDAYHHDIIKSFDAWDQTTGSPNTVIGNTDTGIYTEHEDLLGSLWTNAAEADGIAGEDDDGNGYIDDLHGWNFVDGNNDLSGGSGSFWGHGTLTASVSCGAGDNGVGVAGVSYGCRFAVIKILFGGTSEAVEGFQYCGKMNFKIVNASWGTGEYSQALSDAVDELESKGVLVVCATGNSTLNLDTNPFYPVCLPQANIIGAMSTDYKDDPASFSNYSPVHADLATPGDWIKCACPTGGYINEWGTSFSAPMVSGAAALLWSKYPSKTHLEIRQLILDNVDVLASLSGMCATEGRLNLKKALDAGGPPEPVTADFEADNTSGAAPLAVQFTDLSTGSPTSWNWDFGDTASSDEQNPLHVYNAAGTYSVTLTTSRNGTSDTETKTDYITVWEAVIADFTADVTTGTSPLEVQFTDLSTGSPTSWNWDFGDGGTSTEQNPAHTYFDEGTYTVTLTASNGPSSDTEEKAGFITVAGPAAPQLPEEDKGGGCSCTIGRESTAGPSETLGYFLPMIILIGLIAALRTSTRARRSPW